MAKSADAFRTISEVSELLDVPAHVLRFWESRFTQIKPVKRAGGRRYYRPADVALIAGLKQLLHVQGLPIRDVQKLIRSEGLRHVAALAELPPGAPEQQPPEHAPEHAPPVASPQTGPKTTPAPATPEPSAAEPAAPAPAKPASAPWPAAPAPAPPPAAAQFPQDPEDPIAPAAPDTPAPAAPRTPAPASGPRPAAEGWTQPSLFGDAFDEAPMAENIAPAHAEVVSLTLARGPRASARPPRAAAAAAAAPPCPANRLRALTPGLFSAPELDALEALRGRARALQTRLAPPARSPRG